MAKMVERLSSFFTQEEGLASLIPKGVIQHKAEKDLHFVQAF